MQYRPDDETLKVLADSVRAKISDFSSQHISNTCLAFAKMEHAIDPDILELLGREALKKIGTFTAQALSNTLWSLSKLGIADGDLFSSVGSAARANLSNFNSQNLAKYVYNFIEQLFSVLQVFVYCKLLTVWLLKHYHASYYLHLITNFSVLCGPMEIY